LRLLDDAWSLVADVFARQQLREYLRSQAASKGASPPGHWHPWIPGLAWWVPRRAQRTFRQKPTAEAMLVARDMLALYQVPDVLDTHRDWVARRIRDQGAAALWELRVAGQYAGAGIPVEWSAVTRAGEDGAPDVFLPTHLAAIEVKALLPREDPLELGPIFRNVRRAHSQIKRAAGPGAVVIAIPGAYDFGPWEPQDSPFRQTLRDWFSEPEFMPVSAVVFTCDPRYQSVGRGILHYGNFSWRWYNPNASHPWPDDLPLLSDGPGAT
jgi:hypothetical protein